MSIFAFFSNTVEEFEPFIKSKVFYWPRSIAKKTSFQQKMKNDSAFNENIGDTVYIIAGGNIKNNIKDPVLKGKITHSPMITYKGTVKTVFENPIMGYRYTHGRNPDTSFMLPFDYLEEFIKLDTYLGKPFTPDNIKELKEAIEFGKIIKELMKANEIDFKRAYFKDDLIFIENDDSESLFRIDTGLPNIAYEEAKVGNRLTYREMPSKQSLEKIITKCNEAGLNAHSLIQNLRTWRGKEFIKVELEEEIFKVVEGRLQEGVSTRLILKEDNSDPLILDIKRKIEVGSNSPSPIPPKEVIRLDFPKNQILFGPPGTGKTYNSVLYAVAICDKKSLESLENIPYGQIRDRYEELRKEGRIAFTTFHQSYGYEEFIEGIKPVINSKDDSSSDIKYEYTSGIFKNFCEEAEKVKVKTSSTKIRENPTVWNVLLGGTGATELKKDCFKNNYIKIGWSNADEIVTEQSDNLNDKERRILLNFQDEMQEGDIVFIQRSNTSIDAIGFISGPYEYDKTNKNYPRTRRVEWIATEINEDVYILNKNTKLDRKSVYPLRNMDIKEVITLINKYKANGDIHVEHNVVPYVFIIDEINRGNISKIFGELITLIEPTKRIGEPEATKAILPYTGDDFGVSNNVYIVGTMNTADRSIALMDTALRRRFEFIEMKPNPKVFEKLGIIEVEGIQVATMLEIINERIESLFDREHTIGHAFFTPLQKDPSLNNLAGIFINTIIPLLQEYFYEDYSKIQLVLGDNGKNDSEYKFILDTEVKVKNLFKGNPDIDLPAKKYTIQKDAFYKAESYKQLY